MSHSVKIQTAFKSEALILAVAKEMGITATREKTCQLFDRTVEDVVAVRLKGWSYPVAIDTKTGEALFDNYNGKWGNIAELNRFKQLYSVHKATAEATRLGYMVNRQTTKNGGITLTVTGY